MNRYLFDWYGATDGKQHFRIVWSEDQLEKRITQYTSEGLQLLRPEVRELPKYRQWIHSKYLIEKLTAVPRFVETDLVEELSYEPLFVFENGKGDFLPPHLGVTRKAIEVTLCNLGASGVVRYKDPRADGNNGVEAQEQERKELMEYLYANETPIGDALATRSGVAYGPGSSPNSSTPAIKLTDR
jgi:hypothetical protein